MFERTQKIIEKLTQTPLTLKPSIWDFQPSYIYTIQALYLSMSKKKKSGPSRCMIGELVNYW